MKRDKIQHYSHLYHFPLSNLNEINSMELFSERVNFSETKTFMSISFISVRFIMGGKFVYVIHICDTSFIPKVKLCWVQ